MDFAYSAIAALYRVSGAPDVDSPGFAEWQDRFEKLHGPLERKRQVDRPALARAFGIPAEQLSLPHLLFAVETFLALYLVATAEALTGTSVGSRVKGRRLVGAEPDADAPLARLAAPYLAPLSRIRDDEAERIARGVERHVGSDLRGPRSFDDLFRRQYHALVPKQVRHSIGAHFTPGWLADYSLTLGGFTVESCGSTTLIDPSCGSGQFLLSAARVLAHAVKRGSVTRLAAAEVLATNLRGVELNPLAALAANVNLLRASVAVTGGAPSLDGRRLPVEVGDALLDAARPAFGACAEFDVVVGNPPWVNWEHLPPHYRSKIEHLWPQLGLFALKGRDRVFSKEDVSGLFLYVAADRYLKHGGRLVFVMPQSVFKSPLNARGFRRFEIGEGREPLRVLQTDDLSAIRVFGDAANRTAVITLEKGEQTVYPVPYVEWRKTGRIAEDMPWDEIEHAVDRVRNVAFPSVRAEPTSPWTSIDHRAISLFHILRGRCPYKARTGIFTGGANGVYYLEALDVDGDRARVRNVTERTRRYVPDVVRSLETRYLFPLVRGRDVGNNYLSPELMILCPHTPESGMRPVQEAELAQQTPLTLQYLREFEAILRERRGFTAFDRKIFEESFYALQRIGPYTFAPYKVVWRYIASSFIIRVIPPANTFGVSAPQIPNEKLMLIPFDEPKQAYYVAGVLSSSPARFFVEAQMVGTQISASIIEGLAVPEFNHDDVLHQEISRVSQALHDLPDDAPQAQTRVDQRQVLDKLVCEALELPIKESRLLAELAS